MTMTPQGSNAVRTLWPTTWDGRREWYRRRRRALLNESYGDSEIKALGLFRATDQGGFITHETRRIMRDAAFIARVNASALCAGLTLGTRQETRDADPAVSAVEAEVLARGAEVWRRSRVDQRADHWAWTCAGMGDLHLEVTVDPAGRGVIIGHKPEHVEVYYDPQGLTLAQAIIRYEYDEPPTLVEGVSTRRRYKRILTPTEIRTQTDDGPVTVEPHALGVVPMVHVPWLSVDGPSFSAASIDGYTDVVAIVDSALTQMSVIGSRFAAPWLVVLGALVESGGDPARLGKAINLPAEADAKWLEPTLTGVAAFVEQAKFARDAMVTGTPEYLFADAGASASGTALSYRAGQFLAQVRPPQQRFRHGLAEAIGMALALEAGEAFDPVANPYEVRGGSPLPEDRKAVLELVTGQLESGLLTASDAVAALQALGTIPAEAAPEEYAARAQGEQVKRNAEVVTLAQRMATNGGDVETHDLSDVQDDAREALAALDAGDLEAAREMLRDMATEGYGVGEVESEDEPEDASDGLGDT